MGKLNVTVTAKKCQGNGACAKTAAAVFRLNAESKAEVIDAAAAADETLLLAARNCPYRAITVVDADGAQLFPPVRK